MNILIVIPPIQDFYFTPHRASGLGAQSLVKILKAHGVQAEVLNLPLLRKKPILIPLPPSLSYLFPYILDRENGKITFFTSYKHFGPSFTDSARLICHSHPDMVFISCFAFCYADQTLDLCAEIKTMDPHLPICAGGQGVSVHPEYFLTHNTIDFLLTGNAENGVPGFLRAFFDKAIPFSQVPGLIRRENGIIKYADAGETAGGRDIQFVWNCTSETTNNITLSTSLIRGCTKKCRFCTHWKKNTMEIVPERAVLEGIEEIKEKTTHKGKGIFLIFEEDNLLLKPDYFFSILSLFKEHLSIKGFFVETGIDYTLLDTGLLQNLLSAGLKRLNMSLGSINREILNSEKRVLNLNHYEHILGILTKEGIPTTTYFICGFKGDTKEIIARNLAYIAGKPTTCGISLFYPVPGLPDFLDLSAFTPGHSNRAAGSSAYPWNNSLSTKTLVTAFRLSRYGNFAKQGPSSDPEGELLRTIQKSRTLHTIIKEKKKDRIIEVPNCDTELVDLFFTFLEQPHP